jgi:tetratricopeptide (TPR) repeat protein
LTALHQDHIIKFKEDDALSSRALVAYKQALKFIHGSAERYYLLVRTGDLLRAMGQTMDSLQFYDMAFDLSRPSDLDRMYLGLRLKSSTLISLGRAAEAIPLLRSCLNVSSSLSTYYTLVRSHRELKDLDEQKWRLLISEMIAAEQTSERDENEIYWSLHEAHDEISEYSLAWFYLNKAHIATRASRDAYWTKELIDSERDSISPRFAIDLLEQISPVIDNLSRMPIFIVGMPR